MSSMHRVATAKRRNRLPTLERALLSARVILRVRDGELDDGQAGVVLRGAMGVQWSFLTALQYLSGQEAIRAIQGLPGDWEVDGLTKQLACEAILLAGLVCAHAHPSGSALSAGHLVSALRDLDLPGERSKP